MKHSLSEKALLTGMPALFSKFTDQILNRPLINIAPEIRKLTGSSLTKYFLYLLNINNSKSAIIEAGGEQYVVSNNEHGEIEQVFIIKNYKKPLSKEQAIQALKHFELFAPAIFNHHFLIIISLNGFDEDTEQLKKLNVSFFDYSIIEKYHTRLVEGKYAQAEIMLYPHNEETYNKVKNLLKKTTRVAAVQATGTGKSFLIAKLLLDYKDHNCLVLAPSSYILDQLKVLTKSYSQNIYYHTYSKTMFFSQEEIKILKPAIIILDEFHRCGADEWGKGVEAILKVHEKAKVFGTSATPVRYLDKGRDMATELFKGNVANRLSLSESIMKKILPMPKYVSALYTLKEELETLKSKVSMSILTTGKKQSLIKELDSFKLDWENTNGIPAIFKKHIQSSMSKFLVFCREEDHLNEMETLVKEWFLEAGIKKEVKTYRVLTSENMRNKNLSEFSASKERDKIHLLFSINMLNEGLHIQDVDGVVLLRPTESPTIFYQQIGRCLQVGNKKKPLILDLVNNFKTIRTKDFLTSLEFYKSQESSLRLNYDLTDNTPEIHIIDEVRTVFDLFGEVSKKTDSWEIYFERLIGYKAETGNCNVPEKYPKDSGLGWWVRNQRDYYRDNQLEPDKINRLNEIEFVWSFFRIEKKEWETYFQTLKQFKKEHGHLQVAKHHGESLYKWVGVQRQGYKLKILNAEKIQKMEALGFEWSVKYKIEEIWNQRYKELIQYMKENNGETPSSGIKGDLKQLANWCDQQKTNYRRDLLPVEKILKLQKIGFVWRKTDHHWNKWYDELYAYWKKNGHSHSSKEENASLYNWCTNQRLKYRASIPSFTQEQIDRLNAIDFRFDSSNKYESLWEETYYKLLAFHKVNAHCRVPQAHKDLQLRSWVFTQRKNYKKGLMSSDKIEKLQAIGFEWQFVPQAYITKKDKPEKEILKRKVSEKQVKKLTEAKIPARAKTSWDTNFNLLKDFLKEHGHTNVVRSYQDKRLPCFVNQQRMLYKNKRLSPERISKLESIGFEWNVLYKIEKEWQRKFNLLVEFKKKNGHFLFTKNDDKTLAAWCHIQKKNFKDGILKSNKLKLLRSIGFEWEVRLKYDEERWNLRFKELLEFKDANGTCHIPHNYNENRKLKIWSKEQKGKRKQGKLSDEKIKKLEGAGFTWSLRENWEEKWMVSILPTTYCNLTL